MKHPSEEQLHEYLDHESKERAQIELHLSTCDQCAARLAALQTLFSELESLPELSVSHDMAEAVIRRVSGPGVLPTWLTLTIVLQAALAVITLWAAAPVVIDFASETMPVSQVPSISETLFQLQIKLMTWQEIIPAFQMPVPLEIPTLQLSSLVILFTLACASILWLVGNGLLLRNQIK
jgi:hypothetical protein